MQAGMTTKYTGIFETRWIPDKQGISFDAVVGLFHFRSFGWLEMDQILAWATNLEQSPALLLKAVY
jgi:hypothetical protein